MKIIFAILISCSVASATADERVEQLRCAEIGFSQATEHKDAKAFAAFVDPEARFASGAPVRGREAVVSSWAAFLNPGGSKIMWRPDIVEILPSADLGLSRGPYRIIRTDDEGKTSESWGHYISTWRRSPDGQWRVIFDSGGDSGMTPTDAQRALLEAPIDCPD